MRALGDEETMRGRLVLAAFGFQALGALTGTAVGYSILKNFPEIGAWRWMYATAIIPPVVVPLATRRRMCEAWPTLSITMSWRPRVPR